MMGFFAFVIAIALGVLALVTALQWRGGRGAVEAGRSSAELERLESALGRVEARLDDLQEQQRFLERLVAERPERRPLAEREEGSEEGGRSLLLDARPSEEDR